MAVVLWNEDRPRQAYKLALLGLMDAEMADIMGVSVPTFEKWKRTKARFRKAIKRGKTPADAEVVHSLHKRATGYTYIEDQVITSKGETIVIPVRKHIPGDVAAQKFWLSSRQKGRWSDIPNPKGVTQNTMNILNVNLEALNGLNQSELEMIRKIQQLNQNNKIDDGTGSE
jgi:hypothetical protein